MTETQSKIVAKALKEPEFKAELLKNPAAAVEKAAGVKVPSGITLKVLEDSASVVHLVLPAMTGPAKGELSDKDLSGVSGGAAGKLTFPCDSTNRPKGSCLY